MAWLVELSKEANKFIKKNNIPEAEISEDFKKILKKLQGENINIDIKRLKGKWWDFTD